MLNSLTCAYNEGGEFHLVAVKLPVVANLVWELNKILRILDKLFPCNSSSLTHLSISHAPACETQKIFIFFHFIFFF